MNSDDSEWYAGSCSTSGTRCVLCSCLQHWHGKYLYVSSIVPILNNHTLYMVIICALLVGIVLYSSYSISDPKRGSKQTHKPTEYWYISALKKSPRYTGISAQKISTLFWCTEWAWNWQIIFRFASIHVRACFNRWKEHPYVVLQYTPKSTQK